MKKILLISIFLCSFVLTYSQSTYSRVKIYASHEELMGLASRGVAIDHGVFKAGVYVILELSQEEINKVAEAGLRYDVMIPDMTKYYQERNEPFMDDLEGVKRAVYDLSDEWPVPEGFELGTCGGFLTIDQMLAKLDDMVAQYPDLITPKAALNYETHNGRSIYWVRISDNPNTNEDEPEVLYTGMHHAREAIGMQLLIYYMYYLLENYDTDPNVQYIVNNFELYFVPVFNMDGYAYNIMNDPNGGGMWRKNRRQNDDGSYGVDVNRNYGYQWGYDNNGSSPVPSDDTYRGPSAFSEPETQAIQEFTYEHNFKIALNYHSYSALLLYAWGWSATPCPDDNIYYNHADILSTEHGYTYGPGYTTIYPTNGGSDDWMYGEQEAKNAIFAYTPEVGSGDDGFWPAVDMIIPLCQENMYQNEMAAMLSGPYAKVTDMGPSIIEDESGLFFFDLKRLGLQDGATYTVSIQPLGDAITSVSDPLTYSNLDIFEDVNAAFTYTLKADIQSGDQVRYLLQVNDGLGTFSDTINKIYGTPVIIFADSTADFSNWSSTKWNVTTAQSHSAPTSIADSPYGQYTNYENNVITLDQPIDLTDVVYANLGYWARWDVESGYDYVQVFISDDDGSSWTAVPGKYTHPGNSNQATGEPLYDGTQATWVKEEIDLKDYLDKEILIRFALVSDSYVVADGFYWDDMIVTVIDLATGIDDNNGKTQNFASMQINPNPASGNVSMAYRLEKPGQEAGALKIFDLSGHQVYQAALESKSGVVKMDVSSWAPGMYFYAISADNAIMSSGKFIVK
jgi:carboxypeptidase T